MIRMDAEILGLIAAVLTTSGFVPQVYKTLKTKNVIGISLTMYLVLLVGMIFWLIYGFLIDSFSIKLANIVSGSLVLILIFAKIFYNKSQH